MQKNRRFIIGAAIIIAAVASLVYTGIRETSVYYMTVDEFVQRREMVADEGVRVSGRVGAKSVQYDKRTMDLRFRLASLDGNDGVDVAYNGILPDMFAEGRDVIVEGTYLRSGTLQARALLTSCPSKYEPEVPAG